MRGNPNSKRYLGDSVYVELDSLVPDAVILTTDNGYGPSNTIYMEFEVIRSFVRYIADIKKEENANEAQDSNP